jgi:hypothetical protein
VAVLVESIATSNEEAAPCFASGGAFCLSEADEPFAGSGAAEECLETSDVPGDVPGELAGEVADVLVEAGSSAVASGSFGAATVCGLEFEAGRGTVVTGTVATGSASAGIERFTGESGSVNSFEPVVFAPNEGTLLVGDGTSGVRASGAVVAEISSWGGFASACGGGITPAGLSLLPLNRIELPIASTSTNGLPLSSTRASDALGEREFDSSIAAFCGSVVAGLGRALVSLLGASPFARIGVAEAKDALAIVAAPIETKSGTQDVAPVAEVGSPSDPAGTVSTLGICERSSAKPPVLVGEVS